MALPNWKLLLAFEAVARHGSFSRAAGELNVLQPAMSRRVAELEAQLGTPLLYRTRPKTSLTPEGQILFRAISGSMVQVQTAVEQVRARATDRPLVVNTTIGFASCFLLKRLKRFRERHPEITVELISRDLNAAYREDEADIVIAFDAPTRLPGTRQGSIFREELVAVCAPAYLPSAPIPLAQLARERLLHLTQGIHARDWETFLSGSGLTVPAAQATERFTSFILYLQAALNGEGIALGWEHLLEDHLASGQLVRAVDRRLSTERGYFCCLTQRAAGDAGAERFLDWITSLV